MPKLTIAACPIEHYATQYDWKRAGKPGSDPALFGMCVYPPDAEAGQHKPYIPKKAAAYRSVHGARRSMRPYGEQG